MALLIVLLILKWLHEDFGIIKVTGKEPRALKLMSVFPNDRFVVMFHRIIIEVCAAICIAFVVLYALAIPIREQAAIGIIVTLIPTGATYVSYRNTRNFLQSLKEEIVQHLKDKMKDIMKGDDANEEDT